MTMELNEFFQKNRRAAIALSGGVDSSYLLYAAAKSGADVRAYYGKTAFQPAFEYRDACLVAQICGVPLKTVEFDILAADHVSENPKNRCYFCKKALFSALLQQAEADGYPLVLDGTNASDDVSDRPGMKALSELFVRSPLRECGLTKEMIRSRSKEAGLFTYDKPAYACLATRVPAGVLLTKELLSSIEMAEDALFQMGFSDFRVRVLSGAAQIQLKEDQMERALVLRHEILSKLSPLFDAVLLDLQERGTSSWNKKN